MISIKSIIAAVVAASVMSHCCAQQDPLRVLYQNDPRLFIKDKLVDYVVKQNKRDKAKSTYAFMVPAVAVGMLGLIIYAFDHDKYRNSFPISDLKEGVLALLAPLTVGAFCWFLFQMILAFNDRETDSLKSILNYYHPSDSEIIIVNNQRYYNFRSYIPIDLIPVFDALYEQYHKQGSDYVNQHAAEIIRGLKNWLELHKNDVVGGE